jgi:hypothetical protein
VSNLVNSDTCPCPTTIVTRAHAPPQVEYGLQGLPVVRVNGAEVKTKKLIPLVCGPSPAEVSAA